jgi:RNA polymerase sigma-70 factor (ECF subfamily)
MAPVADDPVQSKGNPETQKDSELIAAINRGDATAFEVLYFRYRDWVGALALRFIGDEGVALDVMQETFLYLLRKFPGFQLTAQLKTFLYPAVRNLSIAARRKLHRVQSSELEQWKMEQAPAQDATLGERADLATVVSNLPEEQREVLLLRFVDGLSLADIAVAMELPLGTVKSRLHYAIQSLRNDDRVKEFFGR